MRDLFFRDADSRVGNRELRLTAALFQRNLYRALKREFQCVRKQVQDDFLPHLAIDIHGLRKRFAADAEVKTGSFHGRTEVRGQVRGKAGQLCWLVNALHPPRLDS